MSESDVQQFRLPDVGEGLTEAEIVTWKVQAGSEVKVNDVLVEIETAKSLVELPSPYAGVVRELLVPAGTTVDVGTPIIAIGAAASSPPAAPSDAGTSAPASAEPAAATNNGRTAVLVGYGPRTVEAKRRPRKTARADDGAGAVAADAVREAYSGGAVADTLLESEDAPQALPGAEPVAMPGQRSPGVLAKPPVRKLAKDLGVDLSVVTPSGPGGVVTRADVEAAAAGHGRPEPVPAPTVRAPGQEDVRIPVKGVRKATAEAMVASAFTAPHVTEWVQADITESMELLDRLAARPEFEGARPSPLLLVAKAVCVAARRHPGINASWDEGGREIVQRGRVNLGIAAATPRGLIVPNVKDADRLSLPELAGALRTLARTAREGKTSPADMRGGTITITNVGVFGVDGGTPILNPGEAAILCVGAVRDLPWVVDGVVVPRKVVTLTVSFDHRLVDGELGSKFLADVAAMLQTPDLLLLWS